jgi:hypothetical protein
VPPAYEAPQVWGGSGSGGSGAPADSGYTKIYSTASAFAALKADGTITAWGASSDSALTYCVGGCYCVYSRSAYLSWSATDGTSCTVNT